MAELPEEAPKTDQLERIYQEAVARYIAARHERVKAFVDTHFTFKGSLRLHRHSVGWDLVKSPVNAVSSALTVLKHAGSKALHLAGARDLSRRWDERNLFIETRLGRELDRLIRQDLLEITWGVGEEDERDALMLEICKDPYVSEHLYSAMSALATMRDDEEFKERLTHTLEAYVGSRTAAADISVSLLSVAAGMALFQKVTPGLTALSASVSSSLAHALAVNSFWAGPWAGSLYYSIVGVTTPKLMMLGVFSGLLVPASILATFAGVVLDPIQRRAGLHERRLHRVIDTVEQQLLSNDPAPISFKDHYLARILDVLDLSQTILRLTR